jgi:hypothetical protein
MSPVTTPSESRREARLSRQRRSAGRRLAFAAALLASGALCLLGASPAFAFWHSLGSGAATASTGTLAPPTSVTVPAVSGTSVAVSWTASVGAQVTAGYFVTRTSGGTTVPVCASSKSTLLSGTSCTDAAVPVGAYTYTVTAVHRSWTAVGAPSRAVTVVTPSKVTFTSVPTTTAAGTAFSVSVAVQSAGGVTVPTANVPVTLALSANPAAGTLSGKLTANTDATGVATFTGLTLDKVSASYSLAASSTSLTGATSGTLAVTGGLPASYTFSTPAVSGVASAAANLGPITVHAQDAFNNVAAAPAQGTTLVLTSSSAGTTVFSPSANGAAGPVIIAPGASSATFYYGDTKAGSGAKISVTSAGASAILQGVTINAAAAAQLVFTSAPVSGVASSTATTGPLTLERQDAFGNPVTSSVASAVTLTSNSTGVKVFSKTSGGQSQLVSIAANGSTARFYYGDNLAGSPAITASVTGLTKAVQNQTITAGAPSQLLFSVQPTNTVDAQVMAPITAIIADQFGNQTTSTATLTIAIKTDPSGLALFAGTKSRSAVNGAATFDNLSIDVRLWFQGAGTGFTLQATSTGLPTATSAAFNITQ